MEDTMNRYYDKIMYGNRNTTLYIPIGGVMKSATELKAEPMEFLASIW